MVAMLLFVALIFIFNWLLRSQFFALNFFKTKSHQNVSKNFSKTWHSLLMVFIQFMNATMHYVCSFLDFKKTGSKFDFFTKFWEKKPLKPILRCSETLEHKKNDSGQFTCRFEIVKSLNRFSMVACGQAMICVRAGKLCFVSGFRSALLIKLIWIKLKRDL